MARIIFINHFLRYPNESAGARTFILARELHKIGYDVGCIGCSWEHKVAKQRAAGHWFRLKTVVDGVSVTWLKASEYHSFAGRLWNHLRFSFGLVVFCLRDIQKADCLVVSNVHPFAAFVSYALARLTNTKYLYEVRDIWPLSLAVFGILDKKSLSYRLLRRVDLYLARRADCLVSNLYALDKYYEAQNVEPRRFAYVSNGFDANNRDLPGRSHRRFSKNEPATFVYAGAINRSNGIDKLVGFYKNLRERTADMSGDPPRLAIFGGGDLEKEVQLQLSEYVDTSTVIFHGTKNKADLLRSLPTNTVFAVPCHDAKAIYQYGLSLNKLFDSIALQYPAVFLGDSEFLDPAIRPYFELVPNVNDVNFEKLSEVISSHIAEQAELPPRSVDLNRNLFSYSSLANRLDLLIRDLLS